MESLEYFKIFQKQIRREEKPTQVRPKFQSAPLKNAEIVTSWKTSWMQRMGNLSVGLIYRCSVSSRPIYWNKLICVRENAYGVRSLDCETGVCCMFTYWFHVVIFSGHTWEYSCPPLLIQSVVHLYHFFYRSVGWQKALLAFVGKVGYSNSCHLHGTSRNPKQADPSLVGIKREKDCWEVLVGSGGPLSIHSILSRRKDYLN